MMDMPKVSVIIPVYNTADYVRRCVLQVIKQTLEEIEIILVDDGSTDHSPRICDELEREDSRIRVIHKKNEGLGMARNTGMEQAKGEYVAFLDSDDYPEENMYQILYENAKSAGADTCLCGYKTVDAFGNEHPVSSTVSQRMQKEGRNVLREVLFPMLGGMPEDPYDDMINMSVWHGIYSGALIRSKNLRFCSERRFISEDIIFDIDYYVQAKSVVLIPDALYCYCENEVSLSRVYRKDRYEKFRILYKEELRRIANFEDMQEAKVRIDRKFLGNTRYHIQQLVYNLTREDAVQEISNICKDRTLQKVLNEYPYQKNPIKIRMFNHFMKRQRGTALWRFSRLKKEVIQRWRR